MRGEWGWDNDKIERRMGMRKIRMRGGWGWEEEKDEKRKCFYKTHQTSLCQQNESAV